MVTRTSILFLSLAILFPLTASAQIDSWSYGFLDTPSAIHLGVIKTSNTVWGTTPTEPGTGEIVVQQILLSDGETIDLPTYPSDGEQAEEEEVFWTVQLEDLNLLHQGAWLVHVDVTFSGRTMSVSTSCPVEYPPVFRITIVAVRGGGAVSNTPATLSGVKSTYRK